MLNLKRNIIFFTILFSIPLYAQTELRKWEAKEISYTLPASVKRDYKIDTTNAGLTFLSLLRNTYYFFISDLDGDNCPFTPSCSKFFMDAVKETNVLKGLLMFSDRFTRDMNIFKGNDHYKLGNNGKLIDPPYNYTLNLQKIKF